MLPEELIKINEQPSLEYIPLSEDPWGIHRNKSVEVRLQDTRYAGTYKGLTKRGKIILQPHVSWTCSFGKEQMSVPTLCDLPATLTPEAVNAMLPIENRYMERALYEQRDKMLAGYDNADPACLI